MTVLGSIFTASDNYSEVVELEGLQAVRPKAAAQIVVSNSDFIEVSPC